MSKISEILDELYELVEDRKKNPQNGSYTNFLFSQGIDRICKKVGEEATEVVIAAKNDSRDELRNEISDLLYHLTVLMVEKNLNWEELYDEMKKRRESR